MSNPVTNSKEVVVIGAGVVGLTTALKIQESGDFHVTIVAEVLPSDPKSIKYTSIWAGAHHVSFAGDDEKQQQMDQETFRAMWDLSAPGGKAEGCFLRIPQEENYLYQYDRPHPLAWMPEFKERPTSSLAPGSVSGVSFNTVTIDVPIYLNYLLARFLASGGEIRRGAVQHISELTEGNIYTRAPVEAIVVCTGLGTRLLGGVEDKTMYPLRGQTVVLNAPWVRFGRSMTADQLWTYIIPRRSGEVVIGGTRATDDWYPKARPETTLDILERCLALCPELVPPEKRADRSPTADDLRSLIIEEGCGLRPARHGGIRLELDWVPTKRQGAGRLPMVYNYGHGGYGYQSSWGSASKALELLQSAFADRQS